jgi:hypothetical protein
MKTLFFAIFATATLGLSACALTPAQVTADIATIQQDCEAACSVIPNALDVAALITAASLPTVGAAASELAAISTAICAAIGPAPAAARFRSVKGIGNERVYKVWSPAPVVVNGVVVHFL